MPGDLKNPRVSFACTHAYNNVADNWGSNVLHFFDLFLLFDLSPLAISVRTYKRARRTAAPLFFWRASQKDDGGGSGGGGSRASNTAHLTWPIWLSLSRLLRGGTLKTRVYAMIYAFLFFDRQKTPLRASCACVYTIRAYGRTRRTFTPFLSLSCADAVFFFSSGSVVFLRAAET